MGHWIRSLGSTLLLLLASSPLLASDDASSPLNTTPAADTQFSIPLEGWLSPWQGDLDGMIERRYIRVLTTYNKSFYFFDEKANPRGITYDTFHQFERQFNEKLLKQKRLTQRHLKGPDGLYPGRPR